jgi:hypothetical protein
MRLREKVRPTDTVDNITLSAFPYDVADISCLGVHVAGNVDDAGGCKGEELAEEKRIAAFAGWVDDNGRLSGREGHVLFNPRPANSV